MRIELEQFLAATMFLGTAGAIGVAVYTSQAGGFDAAIERITGDEAEEALELPDDDEEIAVAEKPVAVVPAVSSGPTLEPPIIADLEPDVSADRVPPPFSEG